MLPLLISARDLAISLFPLKTMRVVCQRTPNSRRKSFWVSKFTRKAAAFLKRGSCKRLLTSGNCRAQVDHQSAWTETKTVLPAARAFRKAAWP